MDHPADAGELFVRFELAVLNDLGYGLDLTQCAATGASDDLLYVSPKSGRAVCRQAGAPYADRLLALPGFLGKGSVKAANEQTIADAFRLTGFFPQDRKRVVWGKSVSVRVDTGGGRCNK